MGGVYGAKGRHDLAGIDAAEGTVASVHGPLTWGRSPQGQMAGVAESAHLTDGVSSREVHLDVRDHTPYPPRRIATQTHVKVGGQGGDIGSGMGKGCTEDGTGITLHWKVGIGMGLLQLGFGISSSHSNGIYPTPSCSGVPCTGVAHASTGMGVVSNRVGVTGH